MNAGNKTPTPCEGSSQPAQVQEHDFVEHFHPEFGMGYFCTPDVFAKLSARTPAPGMAGGVGADNLEAAANYLTVDGHATPSSRELAQTLFNIFSRNASAPIPSPAPQAAGAERPNNAVLVPCDKLESLQAVAKEYDAWHRYHAAGNGDFNDFLKHAGRAGS